MRLGCKMSDANHYFRLGLACADKGRLEEAIATYRKAVQIKPDLAPAHRNLGKALFETGDVDGAIEAFSTFARLSPNAPQAHNCLGTSLKCRGQIDEAMASFRRALALRPDADEAHSNLILMLHYHPVFGPSKIREEAVWWDEAHAKPLRQFIRPHENGREPDRPLRIGYVSPDFCDHVAGRMLLSLLRRHDRANVRVYCYSNVLCPDNTTPAFQELADAWRDISKVGDEQAAHVIRSDRIDILIDAALHTAGNRLKLFARKPAPVQLTYLGYCSTSGLQAMDYRISDPYFDPPDCDLGVYTERTVRLARSYWFHESSLAAPEISSPPCIAAGQITFGSMNNVAKVSLASIDLWSRILKETADSRLFMHSPSVIHQRFVLSRFAEHGIEPARIEFVGANPMPQYFASYSRIDIALDPFPYTGGITTCDTLWMGVPVVSLSGTTAVGRGGRSILSNIGLPELVAHSPEQYVQIAAELASNPPRLLELRRTMRQRMTASPLMDGPGFIADLENCYRKMWRVYCATG
jgi:predicted O-linked N-acetylglucosamine transferase (SPINDLY family)